MKEKYAILICALAASSMTSSAALIAGWDAGDGAATYTNGVTATATVATGTWSGTGDASLGAMGYSPDQTWGTLGVPAASINTSALSLNNGTVGSIAFLVTDTTGIDSDLTTFHFDTGTLRPKSAVNWSLDITAGDLTVGNVTSGATTPNTGGSWDWFNYDIDLTGLADNTLDANGSVTFTLSFTGVDDGAGGHNQGLDNVGVSNSLPVPEPSALALGLLGTGFFFRRRRA
ncbi:PEP-CTERM sorting domain-containing protein [Haloferula chungangensis]|uniref:PEP-CTERM sorting domain-containing protein n=1 Tax=Haloferula chungangensis TaxID=1048331 RepID=A0ABW2L0S6_9BACT